MWADFARAIGREDLLGDPRCVDAATRWRHVDELNEIARQWTGARPKREVMATLCKAGVPCGAVLDTVRADSPVTSVRAGEPVPFRVQATNSLGGAQTPLLFVTVGQAPIFTQASPPAANEVLWYFSYTFVASGNPAPTFDVASGTLPTGLSLNSASGLLSGMATSLVNVGVFLGAAILQPLVGWVMDRGWDGRIQNGVRLYAAADYANGLKLLAAAAILGWVAALFIRETGCRNIWKEEK
jgi:hypothetical protein